MHRRTVMALRFGALALLIVCALPVTAATEFAAPAFQQQWNAVEAVRANFWGAPLNEASGGHQEDYNEAPGGKRTVQYFDKARMELTNPATGKVTNGLLTVEMKSGKVQVGDHSFIPVEAGNLGAVNGPPAGASSLWKIAGDGSDGPSYADLNQLAEYDPAGSDVSGIGLPGGVLPWQYDASTGRFTQTDTFPTLTIPPGPTYGAFIGDPNHQYGQYVFRPFVDFINTLPLPMSQTTGFPISPLIVADVTINGATTTVLIQAFERRVLTFNPKNPAAFQVEFGNIGMHYYEWRYKPGT